MSERELERELCCSGLLHTDTHIRIRLHISIHWSARRRAIRIPRGDSHARVRETSARIEDILFVIVHIVMLHTEELPSAFNPLE